jgi:nucleoside-diphosphate-sugar epimerase
VSPSAPLRISITGATGFVGRHIIQALLDDGHRITALARNGATAQLPEAVQLVVGQLDDQLALIRFMQDTDVVVHGAGAIKALDLAAFMAVNATGTQHLTRAAKRVGVKRIIHISSLAARLPEISPYAISKRAGEMALQDDYSGSLLILRPAAIYGPGDLATLPLLRALRNRIAILPGRKAQRFSLVNVREVARIVADEVGGKRTGVFEIGDGKVGGYGWADLKAVTMSLKNRPHHIIMMPKFLPMMVGFMAEIAANLRGKPFIISRAKINEIYTNDWVVDENAWPRTGHIDLAEGFQDTFAWYEANGWLPQRGPNFPPDTNIKNHEFTS